MKNLFYATEKKSPVLLRGAWQHLKLKTRVEVCEWEIKKKMEEELRRRPSNEEGKGTHSTVSPRNWQLQLWPVREGNHKGAERAIKPTAKETSTGRVSIWRGKGRGGAKHWFTWEYLGFQESQLCYSLTVGPGPETLLICFSHARNETWLILLGAVDESKKTDNLFIPNSYLQCHRFSIHCSY